MARTVWRNQEKYRQMSFITLLIYLNDDFEGGETGYWLNFDTGTEETNRKHQCNFAGGCDRQDHDIVIQPVQGTALISDHNLFHEGLPPTKGTKYVLRTDARSS